LKEESSLKVNPNTQHESRVHQRNVTRYLPLVERVAKVEHRRVPNHMVDLDELVSIGAIAVQNILRGKTEEQIAKLNISYIATATRWAIRNELRTRYRWYTLKQSGQKVEVEAEAEPNTKNPSEISGEEETENSAAVPKSDKDSPESIREAIYETILSIDGLTDNVDGDSSYDFISDNGVRPDEQMEIVELGKAIKRAIESLPPRERTIVEYRFYRNMQVKEIATAVGLSSSRVTRIVQYSLDMVRELLKEMDQID
jgi:RNA polymerase sigma factor (sigma-70 family)